MAAWLAVGAQFYFAPLLLFPILVGTGLGAASVGLMRVAQMGNRPTVLLGVLVSAAVAVAGQHYLGYSDYRQHELARNLPLIEMKQPSLVPEVARRLAAPEGFGEYLRGQADRGRPVSSKWLLRGWAAWLSWGVRRPAGGGRGPGHGHSRRPAAVLQRLPKLVSYDAGRADGPGRRHATGPPGRPGGRDHRRRGERGAIPPFLLSGRLWSDAAGVVLGERRPHGSHVPGGLARRLAAQRGHGDDRRRRRATQGYPAEGGREENTEDGGGRAGEE